MVKQEVEGKGRVSVGVRVKGVGEGGVEARKRLYGVSCLRSEHGYGVVFEEVKAFSKANECVAKYVKRMNDGKGDDRSSRYSYERTLCMFFKWLRFVKGVDLSPKQLLDFHVKKRGSSDLDDRLWACNLALDFTRDNVDFEGRSDGYKAWMFQAIRGFFDFNEAPLTTSRNIYGPRVKRKYFPAQITLEIAKKALGYLSQRERAISLMMLQSGQSVNGILERVNFQYNYVSSQVEAGARRIRLDFPERKGNNFPYFSFISVDAIQELRKWLEIRGKIVDKLGFPCDALFISRRGLPISINVFEGEFSRQVAPLKKNYRPYELTSHMFRKLFKTESSLPERGISGDYVEFMMGHSRGIGAVGGIYNRAPEIHAETVEREYAKLEPFLNIYSSNYSSGLGTGLKPETQEFLQKLATALDSHPDKLDKFEKFIMDL